MGAFCELGYPDFRGHVHSVVAEVNETSVFSIEEEHNVVTPVDLSYSRVPDSQLLISGEAYSTKLSC